MKFHQDVLPKGFTWLRLQAPDAYIHNQNNSPVLYHRGGYKFKYSVTVYP